MKKAVKGAAQKAVKKMKEMSAKKERVSLHNLGAGILFLVIGAAMTVFATFLIWEKITAATDLEKILPEKGLALFVNIETIDGLQNWEENNAEWNGLFRAARDHLFGFAVSDAAWYGKRAGVALYDPSGGVEGTTFDAVTFLEVQDRTGAEAYLKSIASVQEEDFSGTTIFSYRVPQEKYCMLFAGYLTCAPEKFLLQSFLEQSSGQSLAKSSDFIAATAELPRNHALRIFSRPAALQQALRQYPPAQIFLPFVERLASASGTIVEDSAANGVSLSLLFMHVTPGQEKDLSNEKIAFEGDFPELLSWVPPEAQAFFWGNDLREDLVQGFEYFDAVDPTFSLTWQNLLRTESEKLFGTAVSWETDLLPLLEKEFVVGKTPNGFFAVVQTGDEEFAQAKTEKLKNGLQKLVAHFVPRIISHQLADGTEISEVFPDEDAVSVTEEEKGGAKIFTIGADAVAGTSTRMSVRLVQKDDLIFLSAGQGSLDLEQQENSAALLENFPVIFAGPSEEVFAFTPELLSTFWKNLAPKFERVLGKIVSTPRFLRVQGEIE